LERIFGKKDLSREPKLRLAGAGALVALALVVLLIGQPTAADKWTAISAEKTAQLESRAVQIHPGELLESLADQKLQVVMLDVRSQADYNLFHIRGALNVAVEELVNLVPGLLAEPTSNKVVVLMSNDETAAAEAWKVLVANSVPNVYILEGGINNWLSIFGTDETDFVPTPLPVADDSLRYIFPAALGDRYESARPQPHEWELEYTPKITLERRRGPSGGGCG